MVRLSSCLEVCIDGELIDPSRTYNMAGVYSFGRGLFIRGPLPGSETSYKKFHKLKKGMIVLSQLKAWEGAIALVGTKHDGYYLSTQFPTFVCRPNVADPNYIGWLLKSPRIWDKLRSAAQGMGARRDSVHPDKFLSIDVPLPPLDQQRVIAKRLEKANELISKRQRLTDEIEIETNAMLHNSYKRIIDQAPYRPLSEVAPLVRRLIQIDPAVDYTEIGVKSFFNGLFHRRTMNGSEFSWQKLYTIKKDDLVFSNLMAWEQAIAVASIADDGCVGNHRMLTCEVDSEIATPQFLLWYFKTGEGFAKIVGDSPGSIARNKTLSSKKLPNITVPIPSLEKQRWFDSLQEKSREAYLTRNETTEDIKAIIPSLLHQIFHEYEGEAA